MLPRSFFFGIETLIPHPEKSIASLCFTAESLSWICPGSPKLMPPTPGKDTINDIIIWGYKIPAPLLQFGTTLVLKFNVALTKISVATLLNEKEKK